MMNMQVKTQSPPGADGDIPVKIDGAPGKFVFTITTKCNLRCPKCLYLINDPHYFDNKGFMPFALYKDIIDSAGDAIRTITLTGGEATLHPEFEKFIDFAQGKNIDIGVATNGTLIKQNLSALRKISGHFRISFDGYDFESYAEEREGNEKQWQAIIEGVEALRAEGISFFCSFVLGRHNLSDIFKMLDFVAETGAAGVQFHSLNPIGKLDSLVIKRSDPLVAETIDKVMERDDYPFDIRLPVVFDTDSENFQKKTCSYPWAGAYVDDLGDVAFCCHLPHDSQIGNFYKGYDYNSEKIVEFRKSIVDGKLPSGCVYCHRRFIGEEPCFDAAEGKWEFAPIEDSRNNREIPVKKLGTEELETV